MESKVIFYRCEVCGNIVGLIKNGGGQLVCCGKHMTKLEANTTDAAQEKHVPFVERKDGKIYVQVGSTEHPMVDNHYIEWIALVTDKVTERVSLSPGEKPEAVFEDKENAVIYAYCNLHGLWKTEL